VGRVFVVGSLNVDHVVGVERHPLPGETITGSDVTKLWGGKGANQAVAAAAAGAEVVFIGRVGDDADGRAYRARLASRSIDVASLALTPGVATGQAMIAVDPNAENTIIVSPGANAHLTTDDLYTLNKITARDVLLVALEINLEVVESAMRLAAAAGARVVLNLAPFAPVASEVLPLADPVVVNEHEAKLLQASGVRPASLLVTLGLRGSRWKGIQVPATAVTNGVDTTGAGDSYCGTLAARLVAGDDEYTAMTFASESAGRSITWRGAQPA
jgi:ribokinase